MGKNTVILIHGYADRGESFQEWREQLIQRGYQVKTLSYTTLSDEVTIKDIADGFERALNLPGGLAADEQFDAIVHSTGMLVVRTWLTAYPSRRQRLKRLIGLAPANFGSPLAHRANSWFGKIMQGNRQKGENFLEMGDRVLDALELGSSFTWDLAHQDLSPHSSTSLRGNHPDTPYIFILCGTSEYTGWKKLIRRPGGGTDGTVRWAGCGLQVRKLVVDLTKEQTDTHRVEFEDGEIPRISPLIAIAGLTHRDILKHPNHQVIDLVDQALQVSDDTSFREWVATSEEKTQAEWEKIAYWQQFIVNAIDQRGDAIPEYEIQLMTKRGGKLEVIPEFKLDMHIYRRDRSLRCFHVNLQPILEQCLDNLWLQISTTSGSSLVYYYGLVSPSEEIISSKGNWSGAIDISKYLEAAKPKIFTPLTTTLIELRLYRQPLENGIEVNHKVCWFLDN